MSSSPLPDPRSPSARRRCAGATRYNLLLALNLVVFAGLLLWIGARLRSGAPLQDETEAAERGAATPPVHLVPPDGDLVLPEEDPGPEPEANANANANANGERATEAVPAPPPGLSEEAPVPPKVGSASLPGLTDPPRAARAPEPVPPPPDDHGSTPAPVHGARGVAEAEIARLGLELEIVKTVTGYYPSSRGSADDLHRGNEALYAALSESARARVAASADTDGDGKPEFLDPWGRPYLFASADDYESSQRRFDAQGRAVGFLAVRKGRGYAAAGRYQLVSLGSNGADDRGLGDDLVSW